MIKDYLIFIYSTILIIILELSFIGICFSKSLLYLIPINIGTIGLACIAYNLYKSGLKVRTSVQQQTYNFYHNVYSDIYQDWFDHKDSRF